MKFLVPAIAALAALTVVSGQVFTIDYNTIRSLVYMQVLNASDECIPEEIKDQVRQCWTTKGVQIYEECSRNTTYGNYYDYYSVTQQLTQCVGAKLLELKGLTVGEMVDVGEKMLTQKGMIRCIGSEITLDMLWCVSVEMNSQQMKGNPNIPKVAEQPMLSFNPQY